MHIHNTDLILVVAVVNTGDGIVVLHNYFQILHIYL